MKIVGCSVFQKELEHILGEDAGVQWLPAGLHVSEGRLADAVAAALEGTDGAACVYGACFPDIDQVLAEHGARRLPAKNCVEAFVSREERAAFGDRAYILSPGYLREWRTIFIDGHGWDEIDFPDFGGEKVFALEVTGDSMEPLYRDGDVLIVSPTASIRKGDRIVVRTTKGEVLAKELKRRSAKNLELVSLNKGDEDRVMPMDEVAWIARVMWARQ